ncbi:hypothetical protein BDR06DRAFT_357208 [Suillus hirtellus]|nr:hypothetical protein BDR06DRAFT_357208 [Suillus hirtellus]
MRNTEPFYRSEPRTWYAVREDWSHARWRALAGMGRCEKKGYKSAVLTLHAYMGLVLVSEVAVTPACMYVHSGTSASTKLSDFQISPLEIDAHDDQLHNSLIVLDNHSLPMAWHP